MERLKASLDVMHLIADLAQCEAEEDANSLTKQIVAMLGAESFAYKTLLPPDNKTSSESFRYFIGCSHEFCVVYNSRMWMMNDPFLEYARTNTAPIVGSKIRAKTAGQAEMIRVSAEHGFRSGLVIPTHTSMAANQRMGLLYIGSDLPESAGEPLLLQNRIQFGALGTELLLWWNNKLKQQAMRRYSLIEEEIELLQLSKKGMVATEIAAILDMKVTAVYKKLNLIKDKFSVEKMEQAVIEADSLGLMG